MELNLQIDTSQYCTGSSVAVGLIQDPATGQVVFGVEHKADGDGVQWIETLAIYNVGSEYFLAGDPGNPVPTNAPGYNTRAFIDFPFPSGSIDFTRYEISSATLKLFCYWHKHVDLTNAAPGATHDGYDFDLFIYDRLQTEVKKAYNYLPGNSRTLFNTIEPLTPIGSGTVTDYGLLTINITDSGFLSRLPTYINNGFIGLGFKSAREDLNDAGPDHSDWTQTISTQTVFTTHDEDPAHDPVLTLNYDYIHAPATLDKFTITSEDSKLKTSIPVTIRLLDADSDSQSFAVEYNCDLEGGTPTEDFWAPLQTFSSLSSSPEGTEHDISVGVSDILATDNFIWNDRRWCYAFANTEVDVEYTTGYIFSDVNGYVENTFPGEILGNEDFQFTATGNNIAVTIRKGPSLTTIYNGPSGSSHNFTFNPENQDIRIRVTGSVIGAQLQTIVFKKVDTGNMAVKVALRGRMTDDDGTSDWYYANKDVLVDNRVPGDVVITATVPEGTWTESGTATFYWNSLGLPTVTHYLVKVSQNADEAVTESNYTYKLVDPQSGQLSRYHTLPSEGQWYFCVAPLLSTGLVGNTVRYGWFFNVTSAPVEYDPATNTGGIYVGGIPLKTDVPTWVQGSSPPVFSWLAPSGVNPSFEYHLQVSASGTIDYNGVGKPFEWDIDWDRLAVGATKLFFKVLIADYTNLTYVNENTELAADGWEYRDGGVWYDMPSEGLNVLTADKVRYTTQDTDSLPLNVSLHSYIRMGNFVSGSFSYSPLLEPQSAMFGTEYGTGQVVETTVTVAEDDAIYVSLEIDGRTFLSTQYSKGFCYYNQTWDTYQELTVLPQVISAEMLNGNATIPIRVIVQPYMDVSPGNYPYTVNIYKNGDLTKTVSGNCTLSLSGDENYEWNFVNPEINASGIQLLSYPTSANLEYTNRTYFTRLRVWDSYQFSDWSQVYQFRVNTIPPVPTNLRIF